MGYAPGSGYAPRSAFGPNGAEPEPGAKPLLLREFYGEAEPRLTPGGEADAQLALDDDATKRPALRKLRS
jgi:hypothetical protein